MKHQSANRRVLRRLARASLGAAIAAALGATFVAAGLGAQEPAYVENTSEVTATVTTIEPETRLLTLRTEDGQEFAVEADEQVRNFEQIEIGDQVDVLFYEALVAEVTDAPATGAGDDPVVLESVRSPVGEKPAGAAGMVYTAVVTIDEVDPEENTVTFTGPGGQPREVPVERPEMQEFISGLSPGDRVQVTYGEALAVAVRPTDTGVEEAE